MLASQEDTAGCNGTSRIHPKITRTCKSLLIRFFLEQNHGIMQMRGKKQHINDTMKIIMIVVMFPLHVVVLYHADE